MWNTHQAPWVFSRKPRTQPTSAYDLSVCVGPGRLRLAARQRSRGRHPTPRTPPSQCTDVVVGLPDILGEVWSRFFTGRIDAREPPLHHGPTMLPALPA